MPPSESATSKPISDLHARAERLGVERILCGKTTILWLASDVNVSSESIAATLSFDELARAGGFGSPSRRHEYERTRWLLRLVLDYTAPLPGKDKGEPTWPPGWVGSITHKQGHVAVALAASCHTASLGIDAENAEGLRETLAPKIVTASESLLLDQAILATEPSSSSPQPNRSRALAVAFSFKEALFKCCFPLGQTMFFFHDAEIVALNWQDGTVSARLLCDTSSRTPKGTILNGHFTWITTRDEKLIVMTAVEIAAL